MLKKNLEKFNSLDKNKRIVLLAVIPFLLILIITGITIILSIGEDKEEELEVNPYKYLSTDVINPDEEKIGLTESKTEAYNVKEMLDRASVDDTTINLLSPHELMRLKQEEEEEMKRKVAENREKEEERIQRNIRNINATSSKTTTRKKNTVPKQNSSPVTTTTKQNTNDDWGYYGDEFSDANYSYGDDFNEGENDMVVAQNYYEATYLERTVKIKNKSQLTFILQEDMKIEGIRFKKMSKLFATAEYNSNAIDITVNSIKNAADGKNYRVKLIGYNENYHQGIYYEGKVDDAKRKGRNDAIDEMADEFDVPITTVGGLVSSGVDATKEMVQKDIKEYEINEGYKMYFAYEKDE